jgi:TrmH family RNA methyltransferase
MPRGIEGQGQGPSLPAFLVPVLYFLFHISFPMERPKSLGTPPHPSAVRVMEDVRRSSTARGRARAGVFSTEGRRILERATRAGWAPRDVLVGASLRRESPDLQPLLELVVAAGGRCHEVPDADLLTLSEGRRSGLLTALFALPAEGSLAQLLVQASAVVLLVIVDVAEPGNVGALLRTALASGASAAVCVGSTDPFHPKAVRTSLGSLFKLPLVRLPSGQGLLESLRAHGIHCLATVARDGVSLDRAIWPRGSLALLVGNEGQGLPDRLRDGADGRVSIDLSLSADSFCVNAAAAVCLYEVRRRQRFALDFAG